MPDRRHPHHALTLPRPRPLRRRTVTAVTGLTIAALPAPLVLAPPAAARTAPGGTIRFTALPLAGDLPAGPALIDVRGRLFGTTESAAQRGRYRIVRWDPQPSGGYRPTPLSDYGDHRLDDVNDRGDLLVSEGRDLALWDGNGERVAAVSQPSETRSTALPPVLNDRRQVLYGVGIGDLSGLPHTAVLWSPSGRAELPRPDGSATLLPTRLSDRGTALATVMGGTTPPHRTGVLWNGRATARVLAPGGKAVAWMIDVNDRGQAVGLDETEQRMFLHDRGRSQDIGDLGGGWTWAYHFQDVLNDRGQIAGVSRTASGEYHPFLWERGTMTDLGTLGGDGDRFGSTVTALNERGQVIGHTTADGGEQHAFLWDRGRMYDLQVPTGGAGKAVPLTLNERGQISGVVDTAAGPHPAVWVFTRR
mgnify:CR=1 FL=1